MTDSTWALLTDPDDPRHGTLSAYLNHDCRCDPCKAANAANQRRYRAEKKKQEVPPEVHGTDNGYTNYGCREACCRAAHAAARRRGSK